MKFKQNQYQIYVPNASKDENLIVWSVLMADELAEASHGELRMGQVEELEQLYDEFKSSKEHERPPGAALVLKLSKTPPRP